MPPIAATAELARRSITAARHG